MQKRSADLRNLADTIYDKIVRDEVANTFKKSAVTTEFFKDRVKEVIEESLESEKEQQIVSVLEENNELRLQIEHITRESQMSMADTQPEIERLLNRCKQIPLLQHKVEELQKEIDQNQVTYGIGLQERQADIDFKDERFKLLNDKLEKSEKNSSFKTMALQEMEGQVNQLRRICESITDDKETLEKRIEE